MQVTGKLDHFQLQLTRKEFSIVTKALMGTIDQGIGPDGVDCQGHAYQMGVEMWERRKLLAENELATANAVLDLNTREPR